MKKTEWAWIYDLMMYLKDVGKISTNQIQTHSVVIHNQQQSWNQWDRNQERIQRASESTSWFLQKISKTNIALIIKRYEGDLNLQHQKWARKHYNRHQRNSEYCKISLKKNPPTPIHWKDLKEMDEFLGSDYQSQAKKRSKHWKDPHKWNWKSTRKFSN